MQITSASLTLSSSYSSTSSPLPLSSFSSTLSFSNSLFNKLHMRCGIPTTRRRRRTHKPLTCNALFGLGVPELVVIAGVAALVFGPKNLPEVGRNIGKTIKSFQQVRSVLGLIHLQLHILVMAMSILLGTCIGSYGRGYIANVYQFRMDPWIGCHLEYFLLVIIGKCLCLNHSFITTITKSFFFPLIMWG